MGLAMSERNGRLSEPYLQAVALDSDRPVKLRLWIERTSEFDTGERRRKRLMHGNAYPAMDRVAEHSPCGAWCSRPGVRLRAKEGNSRKGRRSCRR
jgi:hypothetical protein